MQASDSSFWRYKIYANIREDSPGRGRQTTVELSITAICSALAGYFSDTLENRDEARLIIWRYADRRRIFSDPKVHDLEWPWLATSR